jgi:4-alpha-glucanotransferase
VVTEKKATFDERTSGVLVHLTSLPGPHGSGDLGDEARMLLAWLAKAGQTYWQMLPVCPPAGGNSPYQSTSAFAGDPSLIDPDGLVSDGLLAPSDVVPDASFAEGEVRFGPVSAWRLERLRRAFDTFRADESRAAAFFAFCTREAAWLDDYALFAALKDAHGGAAWSTWEMDLRARRPAALAAARERLKAEVRFHQFCQYVFATQWARLREASRAAGVSLMGDIPIFVGHDSADVWAHPELFFLDEQGEPTVVAGVPPDYFSATGQRWGNVLYRWDVHQKTGYAWWIERFRAMLEKFDAVRVDHFIGFHRYWAIPASSPTAVSGRFEPGPGADLFYAVERALGRLPIVAEDLGVVTPEVTALRQRFGFPGMRVLQFSLSPDRGARDQLPHTITPGTVVYSGTHDNDTSQGFYDDLALRAKKDPEAERQRRFALSYLDSDGTDVAWRMIRLAMASPAATAIVPVQDLLSLGTEARMNVPGKTDGNWAFRYVASALDEPLATRLRAITETFARL